MRACLLIFRERQAKRFKIERDEETIVRDFGLGKDWVPRRKKRVIEYIQRILNAFVEAEYLETWETSIGSKGQVKYVIYIAKEAVQAVH